MLHLMASAFAMTPEDFVEALYRVCLGRSAEPEGLAHWTELVRSTGDPTLVLKGMLDSPEYRARTSRHEISVEVPSLNRPLRIVDVGAQALATESHVYAPLLNLIRTEIIGFEPLPNRLRQRAEVERGAALTLLPYALGDGGTHTLYVNNDDATSSLFPLNQPHNSCFNHLSALHTVRTEQIQTHRLDDVVPNNPVDFLKLDVQGAELMILQAGERTLSQTAVVHCEVEFSPIYSGQPLFPSIQECLTSHGFALIDLLIPTRYHYLTPTALSTQDRLLWADAVFFRETDDPATLRVQALIAACVYRKPSLAAYLLGLAKQSQSKFQNHNEKEAR
jgi:FkbM family methyltransferase